MILATPARAQSPAAAEWDDALRPLIRLSRTGVLYDRVLPLAHLERLDGSPAAPAIDLATWRQGYDELRRAALEPTAPTLGALDDDARASLRDGVIPLALFDRRIERVSPDALADGSLRVAGGRIEAADRSALVESRAISAAVLAPRTYRGGDLTFALDASRYFSDDREAPRSIAVDFADGRGLRRIALGERVRVRYSSPGRRVLRAEIARADGSTAEARFDFEIVALSTPAPNDTMHVTATDPWHGSFGTGDAYVYLAAGRTTLVNPIVVVEGFDTDNSMNWDELYALLDQENLIETLRADGFDAVVLNFTDATDAVEKNGLVVAELIRQVQGAIDPTTSLALVGASMGGLCSRYAIDWLESHAYPHRVRTWISFDGPHGGADIPLGLQYWINFFSGQSASAAAFLAVLQRPAAREMLLYHLTTPAGSTGQADPMRDSLAASFAAVGGWPARPRRVAIANGSGSRQTQGFAPRDQLIRYEYSSFLTALTGNVWALPDQVSGQIFQGSLRILFTTTSQNVTVSGTKPWDGAPGGSRASMAQLDTTTAPYGDIVALHPSHCFIPTVSALALATTDPFFDIAGTPGLVTMTPFDAVYFPTDNQGHVEITPESAAWVKNEVEAGVLAVPGSALASGTAISLSAASPNPFSGSTRLSFTLPRAGAVDLRVFGVDGREVRQLSRDVRGAGVHGVRWDGRDARGRRAEPGIYFVRLEADGAVAAQRVVKVE